MTQRDFNELVAEERFSPFVVILTDGFAVAIGHEERKQLIVGRNMIVVLDGHGDINHIPYRSIAHITKAKEDK